jgi:transcriptional regulator with XRE-family HTH domain
MEGSAGRGQALLDDETASTGLRELDEALGGLYWGDNVVFAAREPAATQPFYRAAALVEDQYDQRLYVRVAGDPVVTDVAVIEARAELGHPVALLRAVVERCRHAERNLILFDALDSMIARWSADMAGRFFASCCPQLLELGAIAYWTMPSGDTHAGLRRTVEDVTQCILTVGDGRLRIAKAEGRRPGVEGTVFRYQDAGGLPALTPAPAVARVGTALRAARMQRQLSQADVARLAGVSPSAISQTERGERGLSLETLLALTGNLGMTVDELLRGEVAAGYRMGRRRHPLMRRRSTHAQPVALLDDPAAGLRAYLVQLAPRERASPHVSHKGTELVAVGSGLVQVILAHGRPVLRRGEALLVDATSIQAWRNLGPSEATLFWVLRD